MCKEPLDSVAPKLYAAGRKHPFFPEDNHISLRTAYLKLPGANKTGGMRDPKKREAVAKQHAALIIRAQKMQGLFNNT